MGDPYYEPTIVVHDTSVTNQCGIHHSTRLTVTDADGASNSTTANVTVVPSIDNPPVAKAGGAQVLVWPNNHITLYGNASFDDNVRCL